MDIKFLAIVFAFVLSGCSHQIQINPDMKEFTTSDQKIDKTVGYFIAKDDISKSVTTPGGGGDSVTYQPYKDTETVLYTVLMNKFSDVYKVDSLEDNNFIEKNNIRYIFIPKLVTNSSSGSAFTWPPTKFMISLTCQAIKSEGEVVWEKSIDVEGDAEFDEFKSDFSLAARRATEKAFIKLAQELDNQPIFTK
ncbi:hypothetical protein [Psychromonas antarctica]|uniref:hypothetical protein n=1 Tax=Psychromonas antarctica TaxID=67573 RepID=UPI001EE88497|nr:hypothetical protein [Psychromonas antarctica]MCG6202131.1 hypothetical protein [Psychromonas antarctica]